MLVSQNKIEIQELCFKDISPHPQQLWLDSAYRKKQDKIKQGREGENIGTASGAYPLFWGFLKHFVYLAQFS